jgi:3-hydroxyisobutyrate dehydrogenase
MGYGMASNLRKKIPLSSTLFVYDVDRALCDKFKAEFSGHGPIETKESIKETVEYAQVLVSSLPSLEAVRDVYLDEASGVLAARPNSNRLIVETSTMEPSSATEVAQRLAEAKAGYYVDAPVSVR